MEETLKQYASNCIKIVLFGPESTGKTTLAKALAEHYKTIWVPEYMRTYLQNKWDTTRTICQYDDLLPIAKGQMALENTLAQQTPSVLFCDTNLLELQVYSEVYFEGKSPELISKYAKENSYHLYFLTYIDTPWVNDDLRDKPHERDMMFNAFEEALKENNKPYVVLKGNHRERMKIAIKHIDNLLKDHT